MKGVRKQTAFLLTMFCLTALTLFVLQFEMTGHVVYYNECQNIGGSCEVFYEAWGYDDSCTDRNPNAKWVGSQGLDNSCSNAFKSNMICCRTIGAPLGGYCGNASGKTYLYEKDISIEKLCDVGVNGTIELFNDPPLTWKWLCYGENGGNNKACYANYGNNDCENPQTARKCGIAKPGNPISSCSGLSDGLIIWGWINNKALDTACGEGKYCCEMKGQRNDCEIAGHTCQPLSGTPQVSCDDYGLEYTGIAVLDTACGKGRVCCKEISEEEPDVVINTDCIENTGLTSCDDFCESEGYDSCESMWFTDDCTGTAYSCGSGNEPNTYCKCKGEGNGGEDTSPYTISSTQFSKGYTKELEEGEKIRFKVEEKDGTYEYHSVEIINITKNTVKIEVTSKTQTANMIEDSPRKFDVTNDGYYDLEVTVTDIKSDSAIIKVKSIYEKITSEEQVNQKEDEYESKKIQEEDLGKESNRWVYLGVLLVVLILFIGIILFLAIKKEGR